MRRREFMASAAAAVAGGALAPNLFGAPVRKPNILMIPVDDLKPLLGCYGVKEIHTPNIDRLAARGIIFENNACQQAVCGPSRASIMTGLYPDSTGVWDLKTRMRDVNPDVLSLPQYLIQQGYETTGVGKTYDTRCVDRQYDAPSWSIPYGSVKLPFNPDVTRPVRGYQNPETKAASRKGAEAVRGKKFSSGSARNRAMAVAAGEMTAPATESMPVPDDAYPDGALAKAGCQLLERLAAGNKPFFLSVGFLKPHLPFVAPKKYWDLYDRDDIELHPFQEQGKNAPEFAYHNSGELRSYSDIPLSGDLMAEQQRTLIHGYRACVSFIDAQIGMLLDKLDELGIADSTIVCLWGDHGWHLGDHGLWCKHTNYEQAVRAPLIISAPGRPGGLRTSSPTGFIDVFPTLCDLAGLAIPPSVQGKSLAPLMSNPKGSVREAVLAQYPRGVEGQPVMGYTLRDERYRYVKWLQLDVRRGERKGLLVDTELYDYKTDPHETVNLAEDAEYAVVVARFEAIFKRMNVAQHTGKYVWLQDAPVVHGMGGVMLNGRGRHLELEALPVTGQPFAQCHKVTVTDVPGRVSQAAYKRPIMITLEQGKTYKVSFYCRSQKGAEFSAIFQQNGAPYKRIGYQRVQATPEWQRVEITGTPETTYEPQGAVLTCHLGEQLQTVSFADVRIVEELELKP